MIQNYKKILVIITKSVETYFSYPYKKYIYYFPYKYITKYFSLTNVKVFHNTINPV